MKNILLSRRNDGKVQLVTIWVEKIEDGFIIKRDTGILNGKIIHQPNIVVNVAKQSRTLEQQVELQFKSHVKKYLDKGYKTIQSLGCEDLASFDPDVHLPAQNTNQQGIVKPMLCKVYDPSDKKSKNINWLCSKKLDGWS